MIETGEAARCPVCRARFRGSSICSRCGADLQPLMTVIARAYHLRQLAAQALQRGHYQQAGQFAAQAQAFCSTPKGRDLERLSASLREIIGHDSPPDDFTVTSGNRVAQANVARRRAEGHVVVWCLISAGILGLGWTATAGTVRWLRGIM